MALSCGMIHKILLNNKILHWKRNCRTQKIYNWGTYSDDYDYDDDDDDGGGNDKQNFFVCSMNFMITGDENVGSAVTNPSPQSQGQFRLHIRKNWHCYHLYHWVVYSSIVRRVFKKRQNSLNSTPTNTESALHLLSTPSIRFWQQTAICPISLWALVIELHPLN
jgi:hypothetical protein